MSTINLLKALTDKVTKIYNIITNNVVTLDKEQNITAFKNINSIGLYLIKLHF